MKRCSYWRTYKTIQLAINDYPNLVTIIPRTTYTMSGVSLSKYRNQIACNRDTDKPLLVLVIDQRIGLLIISRGCLYDTFRMFIIPLFSNQRLVVDDGDHLNVRYYAEMYCPMDVNHVISCMMSLKNKVHVPIRLRNTKHKHPAFIFWANGVILYVVSLKSDVKQVFGLVCGLPGLRCFIQIVLCNVFF